jgi:prepilin-type processing-associated H-X9-DG protein/prepilin-type N-terminal cleavage/methylation domain-containing protein
LARDWTRKHLLIAPFRGPQQHKEVAMMRNPRTPSCRAFTLVELLVVIGIIALLISILLPSLNKARRASQAVACASNLRQIGMAFQLYANDHQQWYPMNIGVNNYFWPPSNDSTTLWYAYIAPYLGWSGDTSANGFIYPKVLDCPSYDRTVNVTWVSTSANWVYISYGYNDVYFGNFSFSNPTTQSRNFKRGQIQRPADKFLVMDSLYMITRWYTNVSEVYPLDPRHDKRCNVLFADGHVTTMFPKEMIGSGIIGEQTNQDALLKYWYNYCYTSGAWN